MDLEERWTRYCMKIECKRCGNPVYDNEENARDAVQTVLENNDFGPNPTPDELRDALSWNENHGEFCDWCTHMMNKDC